MCVPRRNLSTLNLSTLSPPPPPPSSALKTVRSSALLCLVCVRVELSILSHLFVKLPILINSGRCNKKNKIQLHATITDDSEGFLLFSLH